jgi:hypothetical protein
LFVVGEPSFDSQEWLRMPVTFDAMKGSLISQVFWSAFDQGNTTALANQPFWSNLGTK